MKSLAKKNLNVKTSNVKIMTNFTEVTPINSANIISFGHITLANILGIEKPRGQY